MSDDPVISAILRQHDAERKEICGVLMTALHDKLPWGMEVDLGFGRRAKLTKINGRTDDEASKPNLYKEGWEMTFDFQLEGCDQGHVEMTVCVTGGGGMV